LTLTRGHLKNNSKKIQKNKIKNSKKHKVTRGTLLG